MREASEGGCGEHQAGGGGGGRPAIPPVVQYLVQLKHRDLVQLVQPLLLLQLKCLREERGEGGGEHEGGGGGGRGEGWWEGVMENTGSPAAHSGLS